MTKEQKIRALTELRNKMFPERAKLEFGCEVEYKHNGENEVKKDIITKTIWGATFKSYKTIGGFIQSEKVITNIIGQPLSITDILRMIDKRDDYLIAFSTDGLLQYLGDGKRKDILPIYFNLSKGDLIKNQDEKVIDELIKLFNLE